MGELASNSYGAAMPILGDVIGAWTTSLVNETNRKEAEKNRKWQSEENEKQRSWEEQQKALERQYNTPAAQMERYREANLNPFLLSQNGVNEGNVQAPSAPSPTGAPSMPLLSPFHPTGFAQAGQLMLQSKAIDAQVANQQAQMVKSYIEAAKLAYQDGNKPLGDKILDIGLRQYGKNSAEISFFKEQSYQELEKIKFGNRVAKVDAVVAEKYGESQAETVIAKMNDEMMEIHARIGLWSSIAKLNDSQISLNSAYERRVDSEIERNIAAAYKDWSESAYIKSLKLTEDEKRDWFISNLLFKAAQEGIIFKTMEADYAEQEGKREYQHSDDAKNREAWNYSFGKGYVYNTSDKLLDLANKAVPLRPSKPSIPAAPWQTNYVKFNRRRPTYSGYENVEWYVPRE